MQYRLMGRTELKVSEIGFGAWGIGGYWGKLNDEESIRALNHAYHLGVTFYDTARVYGDGHSEKLIGKTFKDRRDRIVIASKVPPKTGKWPVVPGEPIHSTFPADWIIQCTEESLKALGTDYLDIQQLHAWTPEYVQQDEWYEAFSRLKQQGKVRFFGVSVNDWDPYGGVSLVESGLIDSIQVIYNIFEQRPAEKLFPAALIHNVAIIVRVPFEEGLLTGAVPPGTQFAKEDWRKDWLTPERIEIAWQRIQPLKAFLSEDCPDLATLALKFCLSHPAVSTVIPGMRTTQHVEANCIASNGHLLSEAVYSELKKHAFTHGWAYPWAQAGNP